MAILLACTVQQNGPANAATAKVAAIVSILPQAYFMERIGGDRVSVEVLVKPGMNPATYAPTPGQVAKLAQADVYYRIGVAFENSLVPTIKRSIPRLLIVDTRKGIQLVKTGQQPDTGEEHEHAHGDLDPHIWLDPLLVKKQAKTMIETLSKLDPEGQTIYETNYRLFSQDLEALDTHLRTTLQPVHGRTIFVFHPAYGYFCRAYALQQKAVEAGGKEPTPRHLARIIKEARKDHVQAIFVQPQFSQKKATIIAQAIGATVVPFDPLSRDYINNLQAIAQQITNSLRQE